MSSWGSRPDQSDSYLDGMEIENVQERIDYYTYIEAEYELCGYLDYLISSKSSDDKAQWKSLLMKTAKKLLEKNFLSNINGREINEIEKRISLYAEGTPLGDIIEEKK